MPTQLQAEIEREGFALLSGVLEAHAIGAAAREVDAALERAAREAETIGGERERAAASRELLKWWPGVADLARLPEIRQAAVEILGPACGLVRVLYFDKPLGRTWSLPWHKDMTIAVREHLAAGTQFSKPTRKGGVPHVEAPESVLRQMLAARIHLDDVAEDNGPLLVIPGSHRYGKTCPAVSSDVHVRPILAAAGDVLLMRPLLTHCSRKSHPQTVRRRRVIHLEFASAWPLPDGYRWHAFRPLSA